MKLPNLPTYLGTLATYVDLMSTEICGTIVTFFVIFILLYSLHSALLCSLLLLCLLLFMCVFLPKKKGGEEGEKGEGKREYMHSFATRADS
ncbi:uncharacterized protein F4812DRAFT_326415 [Daldinia caldariorum]|uniref:uncharacterized protein n=1 Tax=Daldinia caldariorum TaxID=326644 RepID=UPI002007D093|nr:uncharacterized protein F4812DRAFT_326415 [Daldinia caldariorum]KAI1469354.1 hypothetical protein F4812DRAFT_326415 [Daldinia caldariorum]